MRREIALVIALAAGACSSKKDAGGSGTAGSGTAAPAAASDAAAAALTCPPGNLVRDGACVEVINAGTVAAVAVQKTRLDELAIRLGTLDSLTAPLEVLRAFRELDQWKALTAKVSQLKVVDDMVGQIDGGLQALRGFSGQLGEISARLGNLNRELERLMTQTGATAALADVRAQVSRKVRDTVEPLAGQVSTAIRDGIAPIRAQLEKAGALIDLACASLTLSGGSDASKALCKQAKDAFATGTASIDELAGWPAKLFDGVAVELETQLDALLDDGAKQAIDAAQTLVNDALRLPAGAGAGSGSGSGT